MSGSCSAIGVVCLFLDMPLPQQDTMEACLAAARPLRPVQPENPTRSRPSNRWRTSIQTSADSAVSLSASIPSRRGSSWPIAGSGPP